jgi:hypothetical protein
MATYSTIDPKPKKSSATLHFKRGKSRRHYQKADVRTGDPSYGPESKTKSSPEFVKKGQSAGADVVHHNDKAYQAGYTTMHKEPDQISVHVEQGKPNIPKRVKSSYETMQMQKKTADIRQKSGPATKRRLPRVAWLGGKNPRTQAGHG